MSKLHPEANLDDRPGPSKGVGRPPVEGARRAKPSPASAEGARREARTVGGYGGGRREVVAVGGSAHRYEAGHGRVERRGGASATRPARTASLDATDPTLTPAAIVGYHGGRGNLGTTFQARRAHLGLGTTRGRCEKTVTRAAPCRFGLHTAVARRHEATPEGERSGAIEGPGQSTATFSDARASVRRRTGSEGVRRQAGGGRGLSELPKPIRERRLTSLAPAA